MGVVMISKSPYSTDANIVMTANKSSNIKSLWLIRDHGRTPFELVR